MKSTVLSIIFGALVSQCIAAPSASEVISSLDFPSNGGGPNIKFQTAAATTCERLYAEIGMVTLGNCTSAATQQSLDLALIQTELERNLCSDPKCFNSPSYLESTFRANCPPGTRVNTVTRNGVSTPQYSTTGFLNSLKVKTVAEQSQSAQCYSENGVNCYSEYVKAVSLVSPTQKDVCTSCIKGYFQRVVQENTDSNGTLDPTAKKEVDAINTICGSSFVSTVSSPAKSQAASPSPNSSNAGSSSVQKSGASALNFRNEMFAGVVVAAIIPSFKYIVSSTQIAGETNSGGTFCEKLYDQLAADMVTNCTSLATGQTGNTTILAQWERNICSDPKCFNAGAYLASTFASQCPSGTLLLSAGTNTSSAVYSSKLFLSSLPQRDLAQKSQTGDCYSENGVVCARQFEKLPVNPTKDQLCTSCTKGYIEHSMADEIGFDGSVSECVLAEVIKINSSCGAGFISVRESTPTSKSASPSSPSVSPPKASPTNGGSGNKMW